MKALINQVLLTYFNKGREYMNTIYESIFEPFAYLPLPTFSSKSLTLRVMKAACTPRREAHYQGQTKH